MAAPMKKRKTEPRDLFSSSAALFLDGSLTQPSLDVFLSWCSDNKFKLSNKVEVKFSASGGHVGMFAVADMPEGEELFEIPDAWQLSAKTGSLSSKISQSEHMKDVNGWLPLLITLLHELPNPSSKWKPYFDVVPHQSQIDVPHFWPKEVSATELKGTGVLESCQRDMKMMNDDFDNHVIPFINDHKEQFSHVMEKFDNDFEKVRHFFHQLSVFVQAYSFTNTPEDNEESEREVDTDCGKAAPPVMVPMADILNHISRHNASLHQVDQRLVMKTTKRVQKGDQVYNTYGQLTNAELLWLHGFAESPGLALSDGVVIPLVVLRDVTLNDAQCDGRDRYTAAVSALWTEHNLKVIWEKILLTEESEQITYNDEFGLGFETEPPASVSFFLHLLTTDAEKLENAAQVLVAAAASDDDDFRTTFYNVIGLDDGDDDYLEDDEITELSSAQRELLRKVAEKSLISLHSTSLAEDKNLLSRQDTLSDRLRYALYVRLGQKMLLQKLIVLCQ